MWHWLEQRRVDALWGFHKHLQETWINLHSESHNNPVRNNFKPVFLKRHWTALCSSVSVCIQGREDFCVCLYTRTWNICVRIKEREDFCICLYKRTWRFLCLSVSILGREGFCVSTQEHKDIYVCIQEREDFCASVYKDMKISATVYKNVKIPVSICKQEHEDFCVCLSV